MPKKVAIIGSGCSGLGAYWALRNTDHEVHLYEAADRLGGHTNTVSFRHGKQSTDVDTGFIVLNSATYPNFIAFLKELKVPTVPTDMTFGVSRDRGAFEWAGTSLSAIFAQRSNIWSRRMWLMIFDIIRFNQFSLDLLAREDEIYEDPSAWTSLLSSNTSSDQDESIGDYLKREKYSDGFRDDYLIPMTAAVWSTDPDKCSLDFPALTLVRFLYNHYLLNTFAARPTWMTIPGGSRQYIEATLKQNSEGQVFLSSSVKAIISGSNDSLTLALEDGNRDGYDHVILATHGDQALKILSSEATDRERQILGAFETSQNKAVLHSDLELMPKRRLAWSSWNYLTETRSESTDPTPSQVSLTYNMNILQHIPVNTFGDVLVTLNPISPPRKDLTQGEWAYSHPLYNSAAIRSQKALSEIQNKRGISYCGAWTKYGFHEDGFSSGIKVAIDHLGAEIPWDFVDGTYVRGPRPKLTVKDTLLRLLIVVLHKLVIALGFLFGSGLLFRRK